FDDAEVALQELADGLDAEEAKTVTECDETDEGVGNEEEWLEELAELSAVEQETLRESAQPVRFVLVKIRKISFAIIHSSTILLPAWKRIVKEQGLEERQLPRDVRTRWNSIYQMLSIAVKYRQAIDQLTSDRTLGM
ncbi:hypothetical protein BC629DRAFT_1242510, partial [Irpex lacteus]